MSLARNVKALLITGVFLVSFSSVATEIKLPVDPGAKNNESLNGIDSNSNNVRDDIEIMIYHKISKDPKIYDAYLKLAESMLMKIKHYKDLDKVRFFDNQSNNDIVCLTATETNPTGKISEHLSLLGRSIFNTKERFEIDRHLAEKDHLVSKTRLAIIGKSNKLKLCRY